MVIREDILTAAARAFGKLGYEKATLDDVARIVGIRKASLYHHIRSKEELLVALHHRTADETMARTREALEGVRSPEDRLRVVICVIMRLIAAHRDESTVFLHEFSIPRSKRWREVVAKRDRYEELVRGIVASGIEAGTFRDVDVKVATLAVLGTVNWAHRWFRPGGGMSADDIADLFGDVLLRGLVRPGVAPARVRAPRKSPLRIVRPEALPPEPRRPRVRVARAVGDR